MFEINHLVIMILMLALIFLNLKTKISVYKILAGLLSFYFAFSVGDDIFLLVIFIGLALYLIVSVFVSGE